MSKRRDLQIAEGRRNAIEYEIGKSFDGIEDDTPPRLHSMHRCESCFFEDEDGRAVFEYDKPSVLFGQFGDERVKEVGRYLDAALETALRQAAG